MRISRIYGHTDDLDMILFITALESDASAGGESPVRAPVRAATLCPYAGTAQRPESVSGRRGPCPVYRAR